MDLKSWESNYVMYLKSHLHLWSSALCSCGVSNNIIITRKYQYVNVCRRFKFIQRGRKRYDELSKYLKQDFKKIRVLWSTTESGVTWRSSNKIWIIWKIITDDPQSVCSAGNTIQEEDMKKIQPRLQTGGDRLISHSLFLARCQTLWLSSHQIIRRHVFTGRQEEQTVQLKSYQLYSLSKTG